MRMEAQMKNYECDICSVEITKEEIKIGKFLHDDMPCDCLQIKKVTRLFNKIKSLKEEVSYLNALLSDADESSWDSEGLYKDALNGTWNGNDLGGEPDKDFAKWLKKRYNLKTDRDGDLI